MDLFREEVVVKRNQSLQHLLYLLSFVAMVVCGLYVLFMFNVLIMLISREGFSMQLLPEIILVLFAVAVCVLSFLFKDRIKTEYEYTFTNGILDFAKVFNNKKRKNLGSMNIRNVEACGFVTSGSFKRYSQMQGVKMTNWFLNREAELFFFYYTKENIKNILVFEPSKEMVDMIKMLVGQGKFQVN